MDYIIIIILSILIFTLISINYYLLDILSQRSLNINQYKIRNIYYSYFLAISYVLGYIFGLYILRLYNISRMLNLIEIYNSVKETFMLLNKLSIPTLFGVVFLCMTFTIFIILSFICLSKICIHHIFCIYLYYWYADNKTFTEKTRKRLQNIRSNLTSIGKEDLFNYLLNHLICKLFCWYNKDSFKPWLLPRTHPYIKFTRFQTNKYYLFICNISPVIVILYDCIFNNFVISHVYYYLLIFIPIMLLRKVTTCMATTASYICQSLWKIYYSTNNALYSVPLKMKPILDSYLLSGLRYNIEIGFDTEFYIYNTILFIPYNNESYTFINNEGITLKLINNNSIIEEKDGNIIPAEEWVFLEHKKDIIQLNKSKFSC